MVLRIRSLVRLPHIYVLLAQILGRRILGCAAGDHFLRRVLRPEVVHRTDCGRPNIFGQRSAMVHHVRLFALQLLDCTTSRRQIQPELMVERVLVRDRLGDIEQQTRGRSELQLEILVSFVRSEGGHGAGFPPR